MSGMAIWIGVGAYVGGVALLLGVFRLVRKSNEAWERAKDERGEPIPKPDEGDPEPRAPNSMAVS